MKLRNEENFTLLDDDKFCLIYYSVCLDESSEKRVLYKKKISNNTIRTFAS